MITLRAWAEECLAGSAGRRLDIAIDGCPVSFSPGVRQALVARLAPARPWCWLAASRRQGGAPGGRLAPATRGPAEKWPASAAWRPVRSPRARRPIATDHEGGAEAGCVQTLEPLPLVEPSVSAGVLTAFRLRRLGPVRSIRCER